MKPISSEAVRRAAPPEVMFVPDLALVLGRSHNATREAMQRGECGPVTYVGRRIAVLRSSWLRTLAEREGLPKHAATGGAA